MSYTPNQAGIQYSFYYLNGLFDIEADKKISKDFRGYAKSIKIETKNLIEFRIKTYRVTMPWCKIRAGNKFEMELSYDAIDFEIEFRSSTEGKIELMLAGYVQDDTEYETTLQDYIDGWTSENASGDSDLSTI